VFGMRRARPYDILVGAWRHWNPHDSGAQAARNRISTGRQRGWGLSLTLVHGCAEAHGGHVAIGSTAEAGTTFTAVSGRTASAGGVSAPPATH
jgi:hypothetical protein